MGSPTLTKSADAHGGSKAQQFVGTVNFDRVTWAVYTPTVGEVYQGSIWNKRLDGSNGLVGSGLYYATSRSIMKRVTDAAYTQDVATVIAVDGNPLVTYCAVQYGATGFDTVVGDDASLKKVTGTDLLLGTLGHKDGTYICHPTVAPYTQCGLKILWLDTTTFVMPIINRKTESNQAELWKSVNNVWTKVISGAITYGDTKELKVVVSGSDFSLYYNTVQVGSTTEIPDTFGYTVYGFNAYAGNLVGTVQTINP